MFAGDPGRRRAMANVATASGVRDPGRATQIARRRLRAVVPVATSILLIFVLQATIGSTSATGLSPAVSFSFAYSYGEPTVPRSVGAQGVQGPTVSLHSTGVQGTIGTTGHLGPVNLTNQGVFQTSASTYELQVLNGTPPRTCVYTSLTVLSCSAGSSSAAVHATVSLFNVSSGNLTYSAFTNAHGFVNATVWSGWWYLEAYYPGSATAPVPINREVYIAPGSSSKVTYLAPSSKATVNVGNKPAGTDTIALTTNEYGGGTTDAGVVVQLVNLSSSGGTQVVGTALTAYNDTATFVGVSASYTYEVVAIGLNDTIRGIYYGGCNYTTTFALSSSVSVTSDSPIGTCGYTTTTGTVSPGSLTKTGTWYLAVNTVITGGVTWVSNTMNLNGFTLKFVNAVVYTNLTDMMYASFENSTLIMISSSVDSINHAVSDDHSWLVGCGGANPNFVLYNRCTTVTPVGTVRNSVLSYNDLQFVIPGNGYASSVYTDDWMDHVSGYSTNINPVAREITSSRVTNSSLGLDLNGLNVSRSDISNTTLLPNPHGSGASYNYTISFYDDDFGPSEDVFVAEYGKTVGATFVADTFSESLFYGIGINASASSWPSTVANPGTWSSFVSSSFPPYSNFSLCRFLNSSAPWIATSYYFSDGEVSNSWFSFNQTSSELAYWDGNSRHASNLPSGADQFSLELLGTNLENDYLTGNEAIYPQNDSVVNDLFWGYLSPVTLVQFNLVRGHSVSHMVLSNNTFGPSYTNRTLMNATLYTLGNNGLTTIGAAGTAYSNITHNTFLAFPSANNGLASEFNGVFTNMSYNAFYDNESLGPDPYGNGAPSMALQPFSNMFGFGGPSSSSLKMSVTNNWFMNLNAYDVPWVILNLSSSSTTLTTSGNRYFFSPVDGLTSVPVQDYDALVYNTSNSLIKWGDSAPIYNTTTKASSIPDFRSMFLASQIFAWAIAPDVNISGGVPVLSYSNGLVAGPQPDFYWHGYNYSEEVEPSYIEVGVNSSRAPPVIAQFTNLTPGSDYTVTEYDHGSQLGAVNYYANAQGIVNQTFDPATMPLDPIFAIAPAGSGSGTGPCTVNCGGVSPAPGTPGFSLTFSLTLWTFIGAVIAFVGLVVASSGGKRFIPGAGIAVLGVVVFVAGSL
jgi:hypothetical protein